MPPRQAVEATPGCDISGGGTTVFWCYRPPMIRLWKTPAQAVALTAPALGLASCAGAGGTSSADHGVPTDLHAQIEAGDNCADLLDTFKQIDESAPQFKDAQNEMRVVGCFSRTSEHSGGGDTSSWTIEDPQSPWLDAHGSRLELSAACGSAASDAATELDSSRADSLILATLDACPTVDEWMSALETYPGILALQTSYTPVISDLQLVCYGYRNTAVCQDAVSLEIDIES